MKKSILFVSYGGGHAKMISPLIAQLSSDYTPLVLATPAAIEHFSSLRIDCLTFRDLLEIGNKDLALIHGKVLAGAHHNEDSNIPLEQSIAYLGLNFVDLQEQYGLDLALKLLRERGRHAFLPLNLMKRVIKKLRPSAIVATSSPRSEAAALIAGRELKIPTIALIDLFSGVSGYEVQAEDVVFINALAKTMCERQGFFDPNKSNAHILGNPAFDGLMRIKSSPDMGWISKKYPKLKLNKTILFADMPGWLDFPAVSTHIKSLEETEFELSKILDAAEKAGVNCLVRPHPSQKVEGFYRAVSNSKNADVCMHPDLYKILEKVDAVIGRSTTVGYETAMIGGLFFQLEPDRHLDMPLTELGLAIPVKNLDNLTECIVEKLLTQTSDRSRDHHSYFEEQKTPATAKILKLIYTLIEEKKDNN